jgi:hypothetical protein
VTATAPLKHASAEASRGASLRKIRLGPYLPIHLDTSRIYAQDEREEDLVDDLLERAL